MKKGLISIVVPVYNAEKYLSKCIEGLINQTYQDIEIILVDDGSVDQSGKICDDYSRKDNRILVIHQSNGGVSVARQRGLDVARGEFITHVDPDDWVEQDALQVMHNHIIKENAHIIFCDFYEENNNHTYYRKQNPIKDNSHTLIKQVLNFDGFYPLLWNSLIRQQFIQVHNITFSPTDIQLGEDTLFLCKLLKKSPKVSFLHQAFYHYNKDNTSSITNRIRRNHLLSRALMIDTLEEELGPDYRQDMYVIKKLFLYLAFRNKYFDLLKSYPEIHSKIISERKKYNPFTPISSGLSLALRINPKWAYYCFKANTHFIKLYNAVKRPFKGKKVN